MTKVDNIHEYSIHGSVGVQLTEPFAHSENWLERFQTTLEEQPDIQVQIAEILPDEPLRYIELHRHGYSASGFVVLTKGASPKKVLIPLENVGGNCVITCEQGASSVPMLQEIIHLTAMNKGFLPLHASAFHHEGKTVIASGWPQGGKTSLLLAFTTQGAEYISDDWTYLDSDCHALGIPLPVTVRAWQLEQLQELNDQLGRNKQLKLQTIKGLGSVADAFTKAPLPKALSKLSAKISDRLDDRANVTVSPERLFGDDFSAKGGAVDAVLLTISHDSPEIEVESVPSEQGLAQLAQMQMHEWEDVLSAYEAYHAAMPEKHNIFLETLPQYLNELIQTRLKDVPVYRVYHPHPVNLDALYQTVLPYLKQ